MKLFRWFSTGLVLLLFISASAQPPVKGKKGAAQQYGCTSVQAFSVKALDTSKPSRGLADNYYLWDNGSTITVKFLTGTQPWRDAIAKIAKEWEQYANIQFNFVESGPADIRVNLDDKGGHNSLIGTMAESVPQDEKTMNLDTTDFITWDAMYRTVLHEFGHSLGLLHEHYSPLAGIPWNKQAVYDELAKTQGWDKMKVDVNLFQEYKLSYTNGTSYDRTSIMHYPVLARWTTNGYSVPWNNKLSEGDKALISTLYPKSGPRSREVPRFVVTDFTRMNVINSSEKQGLLMYPSFNITTSGREGTVYFMVLFFDMDGNPIMDNNDKYNVDNVVATYKGFKFQPGKKLSANKISPTDFEMYIPFSEIPLPSGNNQVQAVFRVFLLNDEGEWKSLYSSNPINLSIVK